jgi:glycosyltransferase involved in cell wall biosynthesis
MSGDSQTSRVSIVIPTFNQGRYLARAIESALIQDDVRPEVIVIDDGSQDDTAEVVEPYRDRIRYVRQANQGVGAARNHGLRLARGATVAFLDSDDYFLPGALAILYRELAGRPALGALQGGVVVVDEGGKELWTENQWHDAPVLDLKTWLWRKPVVLKTMLVRREWAERIGGFDVGLKSAQDVDFVIRLVAAGCRIDWVRRPIVYYRQHMASMSRDAVEEAEALVIIHDRYFARADVPAALRRDENGIRFYSLLWCAWRMAGRGQTEQVVEWLQRSFVHTPYPRDQTVLDWVQQFLSFDAHIDQTTSGVETWRPLVKAAAHAVHANWESADAWISWWTRVWAHYLEGREVRALEGLAEYRGTPWSEVLGFARDSVPLSPLERRIALADRFWADARTTGLIPPGKERAVAGLYLPLGLRAVRNREYSLARRAVWRALRLATDRAALGAWYQFLKSALPLGKRV